MTKAQKLAKKSWLARGVETVEWVVIGCFLAVGCIVAYKELAAKVKTHTNTIGDKIGEGM